MMELDVQTLQTYQVYAYLILAGFCVVVFYSYIYHMYSSEKKGINDYEKYSQIVLDDDITSTPVEKLSAKEKWELEKKKNKGDKV
jgi:cytochrome c oxidase cbb3-type subunit 4